MLADAHILSLGYLWFMRVRTNGFERTKTCTDPPLFTRDMRNRASFCTALQSVTMVCTTSDKQISRTFQGFFKDKLQELFNKSAFMHKNVFTLPVSFTGSFSPRMS